MLSNSIAPLGVFWGSFFAFARILPETLVFLVDVVDDVFKTTLL